MPSCFNHYIPSSLAALSFFSFLMAALFHWSSLLLAIPLGVAHQLHLKQKVVCHILAIVSLILLIKHLAIFVFNTNTRLGWPSTTNTSWYTCLMFPVLYIWSVSALKAVSHLRFTLLSSCILDFRKLFFLARGLLWINSWHSGSSIHGLSAFLTTGKWSSGSRFHCCCQRRPFHLFIFEMFSNTSFKCCCSVWVFQARKMWFELRCAFGFLVPTATADSCPQQLVIGSTICTS